MLVNLILQVAVTPSHLGQPVSSTVARQTALMATLIPTGVVSFLFPDVEGST